MSVEIDILRTSAVHQSVPQIVLGLKGLVAPRVNICNALYVQHALANEVPLEHVAYGYLTMHKGKFALQGLTTSLH